MDKVIDLRISCGCGYKTDNMSSALKHSGEQNHQLTIAGTIDAERGVEDARKQTA